MQVHNIVFSYSADPNNRACTAMYLFCRNLPPTCSYLHLLGSYMDKNILSNVQKFQKTGNSTCLFGPEWLFGSLEYEDSHKSSGICEIVVTGGNSTHDI